MSRLERLEPATLQLLGFVLVSALLLSEVPTSRACVPPQGEGEVRTSPEWLAYQSPIVVDAKVAETLPPNPDSNRYNATFTIRNLKRNVFKGQLSGRSKVITVAQFGAEKSCVDLKKGQRYFLFLDPLEEGSDVYRVHYNPVLFNKKEQKKIKKAVCKGCGKAPKIRGRLRPVKKPEGEEVQLKCNVQGKPFPAVTWKKDGQPLQSLKLKGVQIKPSKRGSRVRIKKLLPEHEGTYACVAESPAGDPASTENTVSIEQPDSSTTPETTPPSEQDATTNPDITQTPISQFNTISPPSGHGIPCKGKDTDYCLNGGKCTQLPAFDGNKPEKRCMCTDDYVGKRCQYLNPAVYRAQLRRAEEIHQKRVLAITGICLALLVVGIMCGVAWYMSRKQRKKWCRKHLMANGQAQGGDADGEVHEGEIPMIPMANLAGGSRTEPKQDLSDETTFRNGNSHAPHDNPNGDVGRSQPMDDFRGGRRMRLNGVAKPALSKPSWQSTPNKDRSPRKEFAALPAEPSPIPEPSTPPRPSLERPLPIPDLQQFRQASRESSKEDLVNENTPLRKGSSASSSGSSLQLDTSRPDRKPGLRDPGDVDLSTEEFHPYDVTDAGDLTPEFTPTNTPRIQRDRDYSNNNPPYISTSRPSDEEDENDNFNATDPDFHARLRNVIENQEAVAV